MRSVSIYKDFELTKNQIEVIVSLLNSVWPYTNKNLTEVVKDRILEIKKWIDENTFSTHFVIWEDKKAIAHAKIFPREIHTKNGSIKVAALASVCVDPNFRKKGLGAIATKSVFNFVKQSSFPVSLFQTGIPDFYKKLGSKIAHNKFINSKNEKEPMKNPFWDKCVMIYPSEYNWPKGVIDLNGPGY